MNSGIVVAEDGSLLDICDCKESAGLKYSLPPLAAWPTPLCSNWSDLLIRKPKAPPSWSNPLDMVIKYFSPSESPRCEEGKGGRKHERGSHRKTFWKQQHVLFYFCLCNFTYLSFVFAFLPVAAWSARYCSEWSDGLIRDRCSCCNKIWPGCTTHHFLLGARLTDVMWRWGYPPRSSQLFPR